ncbi:MAG: hypothetical protein ACE5PV_07490 [Candidatus Poribacteria bacterium]
MRCFTMRILLIGVFLFLISGVTTLHAHEGEKHDTKKEEKVSKVKEVEKIQAVGDTEPVEASAVSTEETESPLSGISLKEALLEHLHNKVVHFPIALGTAAALLLLLAFRWPEIEMGARLLVLFGALSTIIVFFTGQAQEEFFEGDRLLGIHETLGIATTLSFWIWVVFNYWKPLRRFAWAWGLVVAALVLITGFYGGLLSHG